MVKVATPTVEMLSPPAPRTLIFFPWVTLSPWASAQARVTIVTAAPVSTIICPRVTTCFTFSTPRGCTATSIWG